MKHGDSVTVLPNTTAGGQRVGTISDTTTYPHMVGVTFSDGSSSFVPRVRVRTNDEKTND